MTKNRSHTLVPALMAAAAFLAAWSCSKKRSEQKKPAETEKARKPARATRRPPRPEPPFKPTIPPWKPIHPKDNRAVYLLKLAGRPVGTLLAEERYQADRVSSSAVASMSLQRMGQKLKFRTEETYTEKLDGTPVSFSVVLDQMVSKVTLSGVYQKGFLVVTGPTGTRRVQWNKQWLFPRAIARLTKAKGYKPGTTFTFLKFQPQLGMKGITVTQQVLGDAKVSVMGRAVSCHKVRVTASVLPPQEACVDDEGVAYVMKFNMGAIRMEMKLIRRDKK